jgi:hypothetical protein
MKSLDIKAYQSLSRLDMLSNQVHKTLMYNGLRGIKGFKIVHKLKIAS